MVYGPVQDLKARNLKKNGKSPETVVCVSDASLLATQEEIVGEVASVEWIIASIVTIAFA